MKQPTSMGEVIYFTNRQLGEKGFAKCWVFKEDCPECKKAKMGKPTDKGKVKIRATEYVCPACSHTIEKKAYEETLTAHCMFTCPECGKEGEDSIPFKRKAVKGTKALRFTCSHCKANIDITKKMKEKKA